VLHQGRISPTAFSLRWTDRAEDIGRGGAEIPGAAGRVPRLPSASIPSASPTEPWQLRPTASDLVLLAMRASSPNQISMSTTSTPCWRAMLDNSAGNFFERLDGAHSLGMVARACPTACDSASLAAHGRASAWRRWPETRPTTIDRDRRCASGRGRERPEMGPLSIAAASAARCVSSSWDGWPGALRSTRPFGPCALRSPRAPIIGGPGWRPCSRAPSDERAPHRNRTAVRSAWRNSQLRQP
jgi:hypothetical protein